jgi:Kef-type K+ transport system membrane component KefB
MELQNPITPVLLAISIVLLAAKLAGALAVRLRQPAVLGELLIGVILGNAVLLGFTPFEFLRPPVREAGGNVVLNQKPELAAVTLDTLARIGVIILLFEVGLECKVSELRRVGASALLVAVFGVVGSLGLGWLASSWLLPQQTWQTHLFVAAGICATSVGITARVLKDLGRIHAPESKIVLGAAVIDDVLGLVVLTVIEALVLHGSANLGEILWIIGKAAGFLTGAVALGRWLTPQILRIAGLLRVHGMLVVTLFVFCFTLAWLASLAGLDPIIGAFAAGLVLDEKEYKAVVPSGERAIEDLVFPWSAMLVPIFFVMMGFQVDVRDFLNPSVLALAGGITLAAVLGKQACRLGVLERGARRGIVGFGMIPRGEVSLIFATVGRGLIVGGRPVVDSASYAAILSMVIITTLATPPLLSWSLKTGHDNAV